MKNTHFRLGFTRFLVISGPWAHHYFSRQAREVILMGPRTRNAQKTVKTRRKWVFFILRNQSSRKLKESSTDILFCVPETTVLGYPILIFNPSTSLFTPIFYITRSLREF